TQKRQQQISFAHMKNQMENKINQYIELIKKSKQGLDFSALSLKQSKQVWETYQKKYQANLVSALEVEKSFLDWYDSAIIYIEKSQSLTLSKIEVLHSIGYLLPILNLKLAPDDEIQL
ncbi:TolC family protein, partial [Gammaproteobacteria bacterium]|nr:TolC family protein [Gammaproteobacteria bacterium]